LHWGPLADQAKENEKNLLGEALKLYPSFDKLQMMAGQYEESVDAHALARSKYQNGLRR
jgi:hypothetical protein